MGKLTKSVLFRLFVGLMMCLGFISCSSTSGDDEKVDLGGVALAYDNEGAITTDVGVANDVGISPSWILADTTGITYSIAAAGSDGPVTDGAGTTINIASATGKITITAEAILANSGAYVVTATTGDTSPAYKANTMASTTITVTVTGDKFHLSTEILTYSESMITATPGNANETGISPSWHLASTRGITYSIAEAVTSRDRPVIDGAGTTINIDPNTGKISITAKARVDNAGAYMVWATADSTSPLYIEGTKSVTVIMVTMNVDIIDLGGVALAYDNESTITATPGNANETGISPIWSLASTTGITYSIAAAETGDSVPTTNGVEGDTINIDPNTGKITITAEAIVANSGAYVVTATAGDTSPAYTDGSTASTTITVEVSKATLNTKTLTYNSDVINVHVGIANTTGISPSWILADTTGITYSIAEAGTDVPGTDGAGTTINIAPATGKITITDQAIVANSGAYMVTAMAGSTSPAYTEGSTALTTITVRVNVGKVDLSTVALAYDNESTITATLGNANITGISPSWSLASPAGIAYSIAAAGIDGPGTDGAGTTINIDPDIGKITITDQVIVANSGAYTVTATAGDTSPAYTEGTMASTTITVDVTYKVGDVGPAGGKIFYVNENYETDRWRYLEVAPDDQGAYQWGGDGREVETSTGIGTGSTNTANIVEEFGDNKVLTWSGVIEATPYAAKICSDLVEGGYDDWFLPSKDELDELYKHKDELYKHKEDVGGFEPKEYWSSSEINSNYVWSQNFGSGDQGVFNRVGGLRVRAVRAF